MSVNSSDVGLRQRHEVQERHTRKRIQVTQAPLSCFAQSFCRVGRAQAACTAILCRVCSGTDYASSCWMCHGIGSSSSGLKLCCKRFAQDCSYFHSQQLSAMPVACWSASTPGKFEAVQQGTKNDSQPSCDRWCTTWCWLVNDYRRDRLLEQPGVAWLANIGGCRRGNAVQTF